MSDSVFHMHDSVVHMSMSVPSLTPSAVPSLFHTLVPAPHGLQCNNKSTMAECNNLVVDLISVTAEDDEDDDDSSVGLHFDLFAPECDNHGEVFVRDKV
jgi:hypothetical protein